MSVIPKATFFKLLDCWERRLVQVPKLRDMELARFRAKRLVLAAEARTLAVLARKGLAIR